MRRPPLSRYRRARAAGEAALRSDLVDVASEVLEREGPEGLAMRHLAEVAGCSTTVLYRLFGGKRGIVAALYVEGFARLSAALVTAARRKDPQARLAELATAYRANALANRTYYRVMFDHPVPEFVPTDQEREQAEAALAILTAAVEDAVAARVLSGSPRAITYALWAAVHGAVSLELAGHITAEDADTVFRHVTAGAVRAFQPAAAAAPAG